MKTWSQVSVLVLLLSFISFAQWNIDSTQNTIVCKIAGDQEYPEIIPDGSGGAIITWQDSRESSSRIYAQRIDGNGNAVWTQNGIIISTAENSKMPKLVPDGAGGAIITWFDRRYGWPNSTIGVQRVNPHGDTLWKANGIEISLQCNSWAYPEIASYGTNGAVITWIGIDGEVLVQKIDTAGNVLWREGGELVKTEGSEPQIIIDGTGGALICWFDYVDDYARSDVFAQRVDAGGSILWTAAGDTICAENWYQHKPDLVTDGAGGAIVGWLDSRTNNDTSYVYAQKVTASGSKAWDRNGIKISEVPGFNRMRIANDGAGGAFFIWQGKNGDIFVHRINNDGSAAWDEEVQLTFGTNPGNPRVIADGFGGAIISWRSYNSLYVQHINAEGESTYQMEGKIVSIGNYGKDFQSHCTDNFGNIYVTWEDNRPIYTTDIYAHKITLPGFTSVKTEAGKPGKFLLSQNYPNPFNPSTKIIYEIPSTSAGQIRATLKIYDILGIEIITLADEQKTAGLYEVIWNAGKMPSGIYYYQLIAGEFTETKKMILIK
jgi:hypothetical protein